MRIAPVEAFAGRIARLRHELAGSQLDGLVITSLANIAYLSGFFASAAALVASSDRVVVIGDGRYAEVLAARAAACEFLEAMVISPGVSYEDALVDVLSPLQRAPRGLRGGLSNGQPPSLSDRASRSTGLEGALGRKRGDRRATARAEG